MLFLTVLMQFVLQHAILVIWATCISGVKAVGCRDPPAAKSV